MGGKVLKVKILRMAAEGQAIAKAQGSDRVIFVPYGVPGDELEVDLIEEKKQYADARILQVLKPGSGRQSPPCPHHFKPGVGGQVAGTGQQSGIRHPSPITHHPSPAARWCGGCDWQQFSYEAQLTHKRELVLDCIKRIGKLEVLAVTSLSLPGSGSQVLKESLRSPAEAPSYTSWPLAPEVLNGGCSDRPPTGIPGSTEPAVGTWSAQRKVPVPAPEFPYSAERAPADAEATRRVNVLPTIASPNPWRYRNKVQVPFGETRGKPTAGFYHPGTHEIVDFEDCPVQPELSVDIVRKVKGLAGRLGWKPYDGIRHSGWLRHLFIRTNTEGKALVAFVTRTPEFPGEASAVQELTSAFPAIVSLFQNVQREKSSVILGPVWRKLWGADRIEEKIGPLRLSVSPGAFLQVNTGATERLYGVLETMILSEGFRPGTLLDLYSGGGAIALWMAPKVWRVIGVEEVGSAVQDAIWNSRRNNIRNVLFLRSRTEDFFRDRGARSLREPVAAVLDPPRSGCETYVLRGLARLGPERIGYVSCNPATFARDARVLADLGYALKMVQPVDLFPQTSHVELVALFDRVR